MNTIRYKQEDRFLVPMLEETSSQIGKYGQMRLDYLMYHNEAKYLIYLTKGTLNQHLQAVDQKARELVSMTMDKLMKQYPLPDKKNTLQWTSHMNSLKQIAEALVIQELIYS